MKTNAMFFGAFVTAMAAGACASAPAVEQGEAPSYGKISVEHKLVASPKTIVMGYYSADAPPVMHVKSGDFVSVSTMITNSPAGLQRAGVKPEDIQPELRAIIDSVKRTPGLGGHILTGPIYVEGADSGDVLEVRINKIDFSIPYAYNSFGGRSGFIPEDYGYSRSKIIPLDPKTMLAHFGPGIDIPMHPFFGSIGVAPPASMGKVSSAPPGIYAGNLDNKELVAGTTLYIPVHTKGALLEIGDGHAGQGNGEVDITALETSLVGHFQLIVRKDLKLTWPRGETPTHWIAMGIDKDLVTATKTAIRQAIDFLVTMKGMNKDDAYMLVSTACDVDITQLVDGPYGVHVMIPKKIFTAK